MSGKANIIFRAGNYNLEGKQGVLKKNDAGNYVILVGCYNAYNYAGEKYMWTSTLAGLMKNSIARERCNQNQLYGEDEHPMFRDYCKATRSTEQNVAFYMERLQETPSFKHAHQIFDFWVEEMDEKVDGLPVMGVWAELNPFSEVQKASLADPKRNTAYSVRSFVDPPSLSTLGAYLYHTRQLVTWDHVSNQAQFKTCKYKTPGLQSQTPIVTEMFEDPEVLLTEGVLAEWAKLRNMQSAMGAGLQSSSDQMMITSMIKEAGRFREVPRLDLMLSSNWLQGGK